jgi:2-phosphoglycolate phosphatase
MGRVRLVVFDLDGTLIDAYPAIIASFNHTMAALGLSRRSDRVIKRAVGWGDRNLLRPFVSSASLETALAVYRRHHAHSLAVKSRLYPQVKRLLRLLKNKGVLLAVATNRPTRFSHILLRHLGIKKFFKAVVCGDAITHSKPHPQILNVIMRRLQVKPDETLYVGDMYIDVQTGKRAHVFTVALTTGSSSRRELRRQSPGRILDAVWDVRRLVSA